MSTVFSSAVFSSGFSGSTGSSLCPGSTGVSTSLYETVNVFSPVTYVSVSCLFPTSSYPSISGAVAVNVLPTSPVYVFAGLISFPSSSTYFTIILPYSISGS